MVELVNTRLDVSSVQIGDVSNESKHTLLQLIAGRAQCFSTGDHDLGLTTLGEMKIELTSDIPVYHRPYRLSFVERRWVRHKVQSLINAGVIQERQSAYASPIVIIPKKSGEMRLCVDYRALNAITVKDMYPLPRITDQLDRLAGKIYFTTLDLAQGYHQVPIHPNSIGKTAFITPDGQYEYLANSPSVFRRIINKMLGNLRHE